MTYSIIVDYKNQDNKRCRSAIVVEAKDIPSAYDEARRLMSVEHNGYKLGACIRGLSPTHTIGSFPEKTKMSK